MIELRAGQIEALLMQVFWPFVRIGACFMVAPIFSAQFVPARLRVLLAVVLAFMISPLVNEPAGVTLFSLPGLVITVQQMVIGAALGFCMEILFDAVTMGGQLLANSMGLSFAFNIDPVHGASTPALGQFYSLLVTLTFLALNGHLILIETLMDGFRTLPIGTTGLGSDGMWTIVTWGSQIFSGALAVALPGVTALLIVNVAFGVMSRAAPQLNLFAVGFPITLVFGLVIVLAGLPSVQSSFIRLMADAVAVIRGLSGLGA
ncbi:MAG TPA: flagellar biosynthetic protein FliR [Steroidobacteraceae bacterium]|jgi:flagellar biosynthetic protein FliR